MLSVCLPVLLHAVVFRPLEFFTFISLPSHSSTQNNVSSLINARKNAHIGGETEGPKRRYACVRPPRTPARLLVTHHIQT